MFSGRVGQHTPEIVDEVGPPRFANVIEDDARFVRVFIVREQLNCRHGCFSGLVQFQFREQTRPAPRSSRPQPI